MARTCGPVGHAPEGLAVAKPPVTQTSERCISAPIRERKQTGQTWLNQNLVLVALGFDLCTGQPLSVTELKWPVLDEQFGNQSRKLHQRHPL